MSTVQIDDPVWAAIMADEQLANARRKLSFHEIRLIIRHAQSNFRRHRFWGAGEPDCPREIKAGNGELHTLRCKVCGEDSPRNEICRATLPSDRPAEPVDIPEMIANRMGATFKPAEPVGDAELIERVALRQCERAINAMIVGIGVHNDRAIDRHCPIEGPVVTELKEALTAARAALQATPDHREKEA